MAGLSGILGGLLEGDSFITQIFMYSAANQILQALLAPYLQELLNKVQGENPFVPVSPADLADMVIRGVLTEDQAAPLAEMSGISADNFHLLVLDNGEPPGLELVLEMWRRGFIPWADGGTTVPSVERAIKTSKLKDYWDAPIQASQFVPLTASDAVNAWVRNQTTPDKALQYLYQNGVKAEEAQILHDTAGRPPAPGQLGELVNRGLIPVKGIGPNAISFEQGIDESDIKDKWEPILEELIVKLPGIFEIRIMQSTGAIDAQQAHMLYREVGLPESVAASATAAGSAAKTQKAKGLALSTVEKLYTEQIITKDQAITDLGAIGYDAAEATYVLEVIDNQRWAAALSSAVSNVRARFLSRKIDEATVKQLLKELGISDEQVTQLLTVWDVEFVANVKTLTTAEILDAVQYSIADTDWAIAELGKQGYDAVDAWVLLSVKLKARQPNPPDGAPTPPPAAPPAATGAPTG